MQTNIGLTPAAALKIAQLIEKEKNDELGLRLYIRGGGCSGFQYRFMLDAQTQEDDLVIKAFVPEKSREVSMWVDPISANLLNGATVNYKEDLSGAHFEVMNPNAETTCGCGSSFSIKDTDMA